jgi:hypothetical protein
MLVDLRIQDIEREEGPLFQNGPAVSPVTPTLTAREIEPEDSGTGGSISPGA